MNSHSEAFVAQYNLTTSKRLFEENYLNLTKLAEKYNLLDDCSSVLKEIKESFSQLYTYIENVNDNFSDRPSQELYRFQNEIIVSNIHEIQGKLYDVFDDKLGNEWSTLWKLTNINAENDSDTREYLFQVITHLLRECKVNEFELFQKVEEDNIAQLIPHVIAGDKKYGLSESSEHFSEALKAISNLYPYLELGKKRITFLCAALLNQGVSYSLVYQFGQQLQPDQRGYLSDGDISNAEQARRDTEHKVYCDTVKQITECLHYIPLLAYGACTYEEMPAMIKALKHDPHYNHISRRVELHGILGDYIYMYSKFDKIKATYASSAYQDKKYVKAEDIAWLTEWRNTEVAIMKEQAAPYPAVLDLINTIDTEKPVHLKYLGACVMVHKIGPVGNAILALNEAEMKRFALSKKSVINHSMFSAAHPLIPTEPACPEKKNDQSLSFTG